MLLDEKKPDSFIFDDLEDLENIKQYENLSQKKESSSKTPVKKNPKDEEQISVIGEIISYVKIFAIAAILALIINNTIIINATVPTGSMTNTILVNDQLIGFRLAYLFSEPKRGDIIIFKYPDDPSEKFIKRVIGLPGDVVDIKNVDGEVGVYVNGVKLDEPYIREAMVISEDLSYIVPADSYFVLGDNRNNSKDSRYWNNTYVPKENILAKALFRYTRGFEWYTRPTYDE
jgi:signal peptidase I